MPPPRAPNHDQVRLYVEFTCTYMYNELSNFIEDRTTLTPNKETSQLANTSVVIITAFLFPIFT